MITPYLTPIEKWLTLQEKYRIRKPPFWPLSRKGYEERVEMATNEYDKWERRRK